MSAIRRREDGGNNVIVLFVLFTLFLIVYGNLCYLAGRDAGREEQQERDRRMLEFYQRLP